MFNVSMTLWHHKNVYVALLRLLKMVGRTHAFATAEKRVQRRPLFRSFAAADRHSLVIAE